MSTDSPRIRALTVFRDDADEVELTATDDRFLRWEESPSGALRVWSASVEVARFVAGAWSGFVVTDVDRGETTEIRSVGGDVVRTLPAEPRPFEVGDRARVRDADGHGDAVVGDLVTITAIDPGFNGALVVGRRDDGVELCMYEYRFEHADALPEAVEAPELPAVAFTTPSGHEVRVGDEVVVTEDARNSMGRRPSYAGCVGRVSAAPDFDGDVLLDGDGTDPDALGFYALPECLVPVLPAGAEIGRLDEVVVLADVEASAARVALPGGRYTARTNVVDLDGDRLLGRNGSLAWAHADYVRRVAE